MLGGALKKMEDQKGIVVRFIIGRRLVMSSNIYKSSVSLNGLFVMFF